MVLATSLLNNAGLWRARDLNGRQTASSDRAQSTGFPQLDELLIDGGWPRAALVEVLCDRYGVGELRLLASALTRPVSDAHWTVLINPPCVPYAPAFQALGINVHELMVVHPSSHQEALWSFEEVIVSGSTQTVLAWLSESDLQDKQLRRIQAKSKEHGVFSVVFRPLAAERIPSAAELRLKIEQQTIDRKLVISIVKRRGGWRVDGLELPLPWGPTATDSQRARQLLADWERTGSDMKAVAV